MTKKYTRADFEPPSEAEEELLEKGMFVGRAYIPTSISNSNSIRSEVLRALLRNQIEGVILDDRGLALRGGVIVGAINFENQSFGKSIIFENCAFKGGINLFNASLMDIHFLQCDFLNGTLDLSNSIIEGTLTILRCKNSKFVSLTGSRIGTLIDDKKSWPEKGKLLLRGAKYGEFQGASPTSARERLEWLSRMPEFHPQPYRQLAKVMREAGQDQDARDVLYEMEWLRARAQKFKTAETVAYLRQGGGDALPIEKERYHGKTRMVSAERLISTQFFRNILNWCFDTVIGYGYKIERALKLTLGMIALLAVLASVGYHTGYMAPNSAPVLVSKAWLEIDDPVEWAGSDHAKDWETFFAPIYAADVVLPLVDFGQESAWAPTTRGFLGYVLWAIRWPLKLMGWLIISLSIATMTGVVQRRHDT